MTRTEIMIWTLITLALCWPAAAKADHRGRYGPPIGEAYALSVELSREAAALSREARLVLCDCHGYDDVLDELEDLCEEMEDLNRALREAAYNPRKWDRVCKRAEDVEEEVCELAEEIHEAVRELNRHHRRTAFVPSRTYSYRSSYQLRAQIPIHHTAYLATDPACQLEDRVQFMHAIASKIVALTHVR